MYIFCTLLCSLYVSQVVGWTQCSTRHSRDSLTSCRLSAHSRREFVASSTAAAATIVGTTAGPVSAAAVPEGASIVQPGSLVGKTIVITGASTGLGLESAKDLARGGATVVLTARSDTKGEKAVQAVQEYLESESIFNPNIKYVTLDLDRLDDVKGFPKRYKQVLGNDQKVDVLLNNAGVMAIPERQLTPDGFERTFQSNHLGHFVLTAALEPFLNTNARVINVSSLAYTIGNGKSLDLDNLNWETSYGPWKSYGASKLANILFTQELQRRFDAAGKPYSAVSLHPGVVNTDLARNFVGEDKWGKPPQAPWEKALNGIIQGVLLTPAQGAATQVYLAATEAAPEAGAFYKGFAEPDHRLPPYAQDSKVAQELWEASERLSGVKFLDQ